MRVEHCFTLLCGLLAASLTSTSQAGIKSEDALLDRHPAISFIEFQSWGLDITQSQPTLTPITVKAKLKLPVDHKWEKKSLSPKMKSAAVVILHGSAGIDSRGDLYARALNAAGIATLEIDMWEARGVNSADGRPPLPIATYADAFAALKYLAQHNNIDPERIGVLGFSWGGVVSMAAATEEYAVQFGDSLFGHGLRFAAHVAHYPVCWAYNSGIPGSNFSPLTGAPVLIQIGEKDDYDEGPAFCFALKQSLPAHEQQLVKVASYAGAYHAWDRLEVPIVVSDRFSHLGQGGEVEIIPDVVQAYKSREKVVEYFLHNL